MSPASLPPSLPAAVSSDALPRPPEWRQHPRRVLLPPRGWASLDLRELWEYRDLLVTLAVRDVRLRYRQTALGVLWVLFQPLVGAGIFTFVFGGLAKMGSEGVPYFAFALAGQVAWTGFSSTLNKSSISLVSNSALVSKVYFPRLALPFSTLLSTLVDFAIGIALLFIVILVQGAPLSWTCLLLPLWFGLIAVIALGAGLIAGSLMVAYRDVQHILPVILPFLLYVSPVGFPLAEVSNRFGSVGKTLYMLLNPLAPLLEAFRWSLFGRGTVPWGFVAYGAAAALGLLAVGAVVFRNRERQFADVI